VSKKPKTSVLRYSLLSSTSAFIYNTFISFTQFFYTDYLRLSASLIGRGWFLFGIWNTVNDPVSGIVSDKFKEKYKERKKLMTVLILPMTVAYVLIWLPQPGVNETLLFVYFLVAISVFDLLYTLFSVNVIALVPELFVSLASRTDLTVKSNALNLAMTGAGLILAPLVYTQFGWRIFGLLYAVIALLVYKYAVGAIKEKKKSSQREKRKGREKPKDDI